MDDPIRDEQIQVYATTLTTRVHDPLEDKKKAISTRLARTREELDEFNEKSDKHRQDWATSPNTILRMAGNALREIVVCAEEDICMLEDELGRLNGILAPRDTDGPAGRVTSGQYGSEIDLGGGVGGAVVGGLKEQEKLRYGVLAAANHRPPSIPRSPTVPIKPLSASRLGVQGEDSSGKGGDSSSSEGAGERLAEIMADDRVNKFLLGPASAAAVRIPQSTTGAGNKSNVAVTTAAATIFGRGNRRPNHHQYATNRHRAPFKMFVRDFSHSGTANSIKKANTNSPSPSTLEKAFPPRPIGMGLVEWQALHGDLSETNVENQGGHQISAEAADFKMPQLRTSLLDATDDHPLAHFTRKAKAATPTTSSSLTPMAINNGGEFSNMVATTTGSNFGFHVAQPSERAIVPTGNVQARSAGIKDFQVRVWSAAKAAKSNGKPRSGAELGHEHEDAKENEGNHHHTGVNNPTAASASESGYTVHDRRVSPSKAHDATDRALVFRRTKSGATPTPGGGEGSKTDGLDDPFR